ncbi:TWiK family of potassium channels protein 18 isoform X1 [Cimex lectularius]|uniref:Potassium channel domain-containing protein n=1 Tax=Cimex lectularius TaxID=79782 RepID=A0A8I6RQ42_CIMLE|nr:TWiK family of potassium channels protein 18 isoform X1 [Cimex lectularius]XP_024085888.1 TWiK family of potassium channels protein 18 isoform X1 [Cimex lectularius]
MAPNRNSLRRRSARRKKTCGQKFLDFLRALAAFIFSNVGIVCLIVGYTILGAFLFAAIEKSQTTDDGHRIAEVRQTMLEKLWSTTMQFNTFTEKSWRDNVTEEIIKFQNQVVSAVQAGNYDEVGAVRNRWTFSASFLYSLTVITTIGYGNITPTTEWGKFATIVYAIGGMPIFLLFLSNIGTLLAKSCKWTYAKCVLCKGCEPERLRQFQVDKAIQRNMQRNTPSPQGDADEEEGDGASSTPSTLDLQTVTVPISICLAIMVLYVCGGAMLFAKWENWELLDGAYFCFISLSTIGFGDLVPGAMIRSREGVVELEFIFCSTYLLLGMALIAMCFNLMQEEVVHKLKSCWGTVKRILRIAP